MSALRWALHRFKRISWVQRRVLAEACVLVPLVHQLQQRLPFSRWHPLLLARAAAALEGRAGVRPPSAEDVAWAVGVAAEWLPGAYKCLPRAYAAHWLLARHGHASEVQVGVARDTAGHVEAHAWVVHGGRVVVGAVEDLQRFVRLPDLGNVLP
jgi:Transglutaminase-like superfamily